MLTYRRWMWAALTIALSGSGAFAVETALTYVRTLDRDEWAASALGYHTAALVITNANGGVCALPVDQIDWEGTVRRNGAPIDLLRLPDVEGPSTSCERPSRSDPSL